eukprot:scaffold11940_cov106-Isochrysis_galbana.AAC.4
MLSCLCNSHSTKTSTHTSQARGDEARKAQGGGKKNLHLVFRGRWTIARGPSHTPFGGVRNLANTYRQAMWGQLGPTPYNSYSHNAARLSLAATPDTELLLTCITHIDADPRTVPIKLGRGKEGEDEPSLESNQRPWL